MAHSIKLPFRPSSSNCLSWSQDNQIAILGGDRVAIVSPNLKESKPDGQQWETTLVKVNGFTAQELPRKDPLSTRNLSLGEELSNREAIAAKWSPPGLANHKRCALAVLTADHILSIWTAEGPSESSTSWKRVLIVNNAVQEFYDGTAQRLDGEDEQAWTESKQVQQRIRSFAWSPALHTGLSDGSLYKTLDWGDQLLAVSTQGRQILFFEIQSPHTDFSTTSTWKVTTVGSCETAVLNDKYTPVQHSGKALVAEHVCWREWVPEQNSQSKLCQVTRLAFTVRGQLCALSVRWHQGNEAARLEVLNPPRRYLAGRADITGPLEFVPETEATSLIAFADNVIFRVSLTDDGPESSASCHLDGRWDNITGLALTLDQEKNRYLHFVSQLSSAHACTCALQLPSSEVKFGNTSRPLWPQSITHARTAFGQEHGVGEAVRERNWGMTSSPLGNCVAVCFSFHPSAMIEVKSSIGESSVLCLFQEHSTIGTFVPDLGDAGVPSTEVIMSSLQQYLKQHGLSDRANLVKQLVEVPPRKGEPSHTHMSSFNENTEACIDCDPSPLFGSESRASDFAPVLLRELRTSMYSHPTMRTLRANYLIDLATQGCTLQVEAIRIAVQHLLSSVLQLPSGMLAADDSLSFTIRKIFAAIKRRLNTQVQVSDDDDAPEQCKTCQQAIPFEGLKWAKCLEGHQYRRCWLSFLAIQDSSQTKTCGICGLQYLGDGIVPQQLRPVSSEEDMKMVDVPSSEIDPSDQTHGSWVEVRRTKQDDKPTLGWLLFSACDLCLYCGGKFVG